MTEPSGPAWCARFPGSDSLDDLIDPFKTGATNFIGAIRDAGASVTISATYRPPERAYLMHWACLVAGYRDKAGTFHQVAPADVPAMDGVDIDWMHGGDGAAAVAAAVAMRQGYGIVYPAACVSEHTKRDAVDMTIVFKGTIWVKDARSVIKQVDKQSDLWPIGATYGVHKLPSDPPHWSGTGH